MEQRKDESSISQQEMRAHSKGKSASPKAPENPAGDTGERNQRDADPPVKGCDRHVISIAVRRFDALRKLAMFASI